MIPALLLQAAVPAVNWRSVAAENINVPPSMFMCNNVPGEPLYALFIENDAGRHVVHFSRAQGGTFTEFTSKAGLNWMKTGVDRGEQVWQLDVKVPASNPIEAVRLLMFQHPHGSIPRYPDLLHTADITVTYKGAPERTATCHTAPLPQPGAFE